MIGRLSIAIIVFAAGVIAASLFPGLSDSLRKAVGLSSPHAEHVRADVTEHSSSKTQGNDDKQSLKLTDEQIAAARIELVATQAGTLVRRLTVPGTIVPHADRLAHVSVKLMATVGELRKKLGDPVAKDEVIAVLESREVADAKSEYLATKLASELNQDLHERDKVLWEKRIAPEQQYLRSRNLAATSRMRFDIARQKLLALGLLEKEIAGLPDEPEALLRRQEVRSPMAGRVVERKVDLGTAVGRDNLETELFVIADLDRVWVELAVSPADLPLVREGQGVVITIRAAKDKADGRIVFISPLLDKETRSARVVAEIENGGGMWRPGSFVTAAIAVDEQAARLVVPSSAVQSVGGDKIVFVRLADGFEKRPVVVGRNDTRSTEIVTGLQAGDMVAAANAFLLKAEMLKGQLED
jgi:cobalt-zinc-cadmium efflux system membrane fusion protein